jgi:hypothetical protein
MLEAVVTGHSEVCWPLVCTTPGPVMRSVPLWALYDGTWRRLFASRRTAYSDVNRSTQSELKYGLGLFAFRN